MQGLSERTAELTEDIEEMQELRDALNEDPVMQDIAELLDSEEEL
jgi:hypothetical protein